jgi:hypothetical protein
VDLDDAELAHLVGQAWELRGTPYIYDACAAIVDWHDRRLMRRWERIALLLELVSNGRG